MPKKSEYSIRIEPLGLDLLAPGGVNLASFLMQKGIHLRSDCGGKGVCGKCGVRIGDPACPDETHRGRSKDALTCQHGTHRGPSRDALACPHETLRGLSKDALACQVEVTADMLVEISLAGLIAPSEAIEKANALENLPPRPGGGAGFGIAIDLGTTAVAGFLCDYATGAVPASAVVQNPQAAYGADVMSRICAAANNAEHLRLLRELAVSAADELITSVTRSAGIDPDRIDEVIVVGNPTMLHLFLGINPASIGQSPFEPAFRKSRDIPASEIGLRSNRRARIVTLPLVSGFIGADLVSAALSQRLRECPDGTLLIDIGTNGEIILKANGGFYATSCATGPAFEGATISRGMLAVSGAIDSFRIDPDDGAPVYTVIARKNGRNYSVSGTGVKEETSAKPSPEAKARGICGSGLISAAAALLTAGIIDPTGRFNPKSRHPNLRIEDGAPPEFVLVPAGEAVAGDVTLTQKDVRELQLAKGAIRTGIDMLCGAAGRGMPERIILAGSFGSHLKIEDLVTIGLLPPIAPVKVNIVGNAAGAGAVMAAIDPRMREEATAFAEEIRVVELATHPDFQKVFLGSLSFPEG